VSGPPGSFAPEMRVGHSGPASDKGHTAMLAATFGTGQVLWSIFWFFIFFVWIMLIFQVTVDIFRSRDLGGFAKFLWLLFILLTPYLGVFVYLIARGGKMAENQMAVMQQNQAAMDSYIRDAAGTSSSPAAELERLAGLRDRGVISETEFASLKAKVIA